MAPTLYHVPGTISSPIYQALIEIGAVDDSVKVETLAFSDLKSPEHLARNPMGTSPTLTDDGIAIWESGAVLTWLLEQYDNDYKLSPQPGVASPADRAKFLHLQQYILTTVYPFVASLFIHTLKPLAELDTAYVELSKSKWRTLLAPTLVGFLGDSAFFMGNKLSAVDLLVAKPLRNAHSLGVLEEFPSLYALFQTIQSLSSYETAYSPPQKKTDDSSTQSRSLILAPAPTQPKSS